jgi:hypothetical protein
MGSGESNFLIPHSPLATRHSRFCPRSPFPTNYDNVIGNSGLYLLEGTIKYVFSIA